VHVHTYTRRRRRRKRGDSTTIECLFSMTPLPHKAEKHVDPAAVLLLAGGSLSTKALNHGRA
jgi:hypothetical protein